jgi:hypothetical protein
MHQAVEPAMRRLFDVQYHWHQAYQSYFSPHEFRRSINACIQELRNVTFVLQNNKKDIPNFEAWYTPWQEKMKANSDSRWLVDARNRVVKQGALNINSSLVVSIVGSYLEHEVPQTKLTLTPELGNDDIYQIISSSKMPRDVLDKSYVKIERRWVDDKNPSIELLALLSECWLAISNLLIDAPESLTDSSPGQDRFEILPPCMHQGSEDRSIWLKIKNETLIPVKMEFRDVEPTNEKEVKERYKDSPLFESKNEPGNFEETCRLFFEQAMFVLKKDGYHVHMAALLVEDRGIQFVELSSEDQADKYRMVRLLASEVEKIGADSCFIISEVWQAPFDPEHPYRHAVDSPQRTEALTLVGISRKELGVSFTAPFSRKGNEIVFSSVRKEGIEGWNVVQPILDVWRKRADRSANT